MREVLDRETIIAPATAPGRSAIAVIRISGPDAAQVLACIARPVSGADAFPVRRPTLAVLVDQAGAEIDRGVVTRMRAPRSYTGEDMAEVSCHGSLAVVRELLASASACGARPADPGEFTLRALEAGKLDLAQAEAVSDLVDATTVEQARVAARQLGGEVSRDLGPLAEEAFELLADLEAGLDFAEEERALREATEGLAARCRRIVEGLDRVAAASETARRVREGARVVLTGPPNAGKSALFNSLVGFDRAIVTNEPGTTRDLIEETIVLDGLPVVLVDGAGIREPRASEAEKEGIRRAREAVASADLVVDVVSLVGPPTSELLADVPVPSTLPRLRVWTHADLQDKEAPPSPSRDSAASRDLRIDALRGKGIESVRRAVAEALGAPGASPLESVALATERHRVRAAVAREHLSAAAEMLGQDAEAELIAVELRESVRALQEILGHVGPEDLLGRIFSRFCIGK